MLPARRVARTLRQRGPARANAQARTRNGRMRARATSRSRPAPGVRAARPNRAREWIVARHPPLSVASTEARLPRSAPTGADRAWAAVIAAADIGHRWRAAAVLAAARASMEAADGGCTAAAEAADVAAAVVVAGGGADLNLG